MHSYIRLRGNRKVHIKKLIDQYVRFVRNHYSQYGIVCVVFDGYSDKWSLKSPEHQRRMKTRSVNIIISESMNVSSGSSLSADIFVAKKVNEDHWHQDVPKVYFNTAWKDRKSRAKLLKHYDFGALATNTPLREHILFAHAWSGYDTTSATYRKGKTKIVQLLKSLDMQKLALKFGNFTSEQSQIGHAGCEIFF